jgi:hypothetical protein
MARIDRPEAERRLTELLRVLSIVPQAQRQAVREAYDVLSEQHLAGLQQDDFEALAGRQAQAQAELAARLTLERTFAQRRVAARLTEQQATELADCIRLGTRLSAPTLAAIQALTGDNGRLGTQLLVEFPFLAA